MGSANLVEASARESSIRFQAEGALHRDTLTALWVQVWVQLKKEKWLPISRKRHQIGHLDFQSFRLLTEGLQRPGSIGVGSTRHSCLRLWAASRRFAAMSFPPKVSHEFGMDASPALSVI